MSSARAALRPNGAPSAKRDFVKRAYGFVKRAPGFPMLWIGGATAAGIMIVTGGFGTGAMPLGQRIGFWAVLMGWSSLKWQLWFLATVRKHTDWVWAAAVGALLLSLPLPLEIELSAIAALVRDGFMVVAGGGGGIPVVEHEDGRFTGVEAVVDKDFASALLASALGADLLVMTTGVPQVAVDFGTPRQRFLERMTVSETEALQADGQFPPGSMGPKIEAALQFVRSGGHEALITSVDRLAEAVRGGSGTRLVPDAATVAA